MTDPTASLLDQSRSILKSTFGYDQFRFQQEKAISHALHSQDALVIMPTGGGKSLCYQIPALVKKGACLVISPLISLMKDQVEALKQNGVSAAFLNSSISGAQQQQVEEDFMAGQIKLLYVSPEKLMTRDFFNVLKSSTLNLIAVDEAHCISQWGHDFRPEYTKLKFLKEQFPEVPIMALTATADKATRNDILSQLNITQAKTFLSSFDRPNLSLAVRPAQKRVDAIIDWIKNQPDESGIIYCLSRKNTESLALKLQKQGIDADFYHAGMDPQVKDKVQERFTKDDLKVVCATIAFGMGIDKSNVRWVIHHNLPKNLESYYQEIGRAGRDGVASKTLLFYSYSDVMQLRQFIAEGEQKELLEAKLQRMQQFAEATSCRRKLLLSYFGEQLEKDCGNCDICRNPPVFIDGLQLAQMALSAVARTQEKVGAHMLIDILRGSGRQDLFQQGYQNIKTYGVGKAHSFVDWQHYIGQFLNLGLLEIAFDKGNILRITALGKKALYGETEVKISRPETQEQRKQRLAPPAPTKKAVQTDALFEKLRKLRKQIAESQGVPAYVVFSDATLQELSIHKPTTDDEILNVSGVGERKASQYGRAFIDEIITFIKEKTLEGDKIKGATHLVTYELVKEGLTPEEIATKRKLNKVTIYSHLATLYAQGKEVDLRQYISDKEQALIFKAIEETGETEKLKPIFDFLDQKVPYDKLRLALALYNKSVA